MNAPAGVTIKPNHPSRILSGTMVKSEGRQNSTHALGVHSEGLTSSLEICVCNVRQIPKRESPLLWVDMNLLEQGRKNGGLVGGQRLALERGLLRHAFQQPRATFQVFPDRKGQGLIQVAIPSAQPGEPADLRQLKLMIVLTPV